MKSILVTLLFTAASTVASAQLSNPDFETGDFTGWTASDGAQVWSPDQEMFTGISPFQGTFYAALLPGSSIVTTNGIYLRAGDRVSAWMNGSDGYGYLQVGMVNGGWGASEGWTPHYEPGSQYPFKWNQISITVQENGIYKIGAWSPDFEGGPSFFGVDQFTITPVPEASTYGLLASVLGVAAIMRRRRRALAPSVVIR